MPTRRKVDQNAGNTGNRAPAVLDVYEMTPQEAAAFEVYEERADRRLPVVGMKSHGDQADPSRPGLAIDHIDPKTAVRLWMLGMGTTDPRTADALTGQLANLSVRNGVLDVNLLNQHMAFVQSMEPRDPLEAALAGQMSAVHTAMMDMARRLGAATNFQQVDTYERAMNKLARTYTTQMETLKKVRSKGEQKVIVEHQHVHVHPGGQAVVGNVTHGVGGEGSIETQGQPHERSEPVRIPERSAVPCDLEADGLPMPSTGGEGVESLSVSRRPRRTALRAVE